MRSIGKRNIKKLRELVRNHQQFRDEQIEELVPESWYDIWESAWAEIRRVISDERSAITIERRDNG